MKCFCTCDAFHISNSIRCFWASVCVCVYVWNIWRDVKLLTCTFVNLHLFNSAETSFFHFSRGQWPTHESTANEATHELGGYRDWSSRHTCIFVKPTFLQWDVANPRTTLPLSNNQFLFAFALLSQSENSSFLVAKGFPVRWIWIVFARKMHSSS